MNADRRATQPGENLPTLIRWLLRLTTTPAELPYILDDLDEEFTARVATHGRRSARRWTYRQTLRSLGPLTAARLRAHRASQDDLPTGDPMLTQLRDDLRYSLRIAARRPWLSLTISATMALGIGSTTAVFSLIEALLLRPLAFPVPDQLVRLTSPVPDAPSAMVVSYPDITELAQSSRSIASLGLYDGRTVTAQVGEEPERLGAVLAGPGFAETLALRPTLGRLFSPDEYVATGPSPVLLTHAFWISHFAGKRDVIGHSITISGKPCTVVGVLPPFESAFPAGPYPSGDFDIWLPLVVPEDSFLRNRFAMQLSAIARLRPGVTVDRTNSELAAFARRLATDYPQTNTGRTLRAVPLRETIVGPIRPMLFLLGTAVGAVLLIACANLGSLLLAHSQSRVREFAVRAAMGGAWTRIARQLLIEHLMLAAVGGAAGVWLATTLVKGLVAVYPTQLPRANEIGIDARVLLVALGATFLAGWLAGTPLARQVRRLDLARDLREGERGLGSRGRRRLLDGLVVGQVAMSVALLFAAGVLMRTFLSMTAINPGFDARNVLTFDFGISSARYPTPERQSAFYSALFDSVRAMPLTQDVGWGMFTPLAGGGWGDTFAREGSSDAAPNLPSMQVKMISPGYTSTLRIPQLAGRPFANLDRDDAPSVALINATLAARYYAGTNPVGKRITFQKRTLEIVGVVGDVRSQSLWLMPTPELYVPIEQWGWRGGTVFMRTTSDPRSAQTRVRAIVHAMDASIPMLNVTPFEARVRRSMAAERFRAILLGTLATLALLLSVLGIYGLVAWVVGRRVREIGIRMALGEAATRVRFRVLADAVRLGAIGVGLGVALAYGASYYLRAFVAGDIRALDPLTLLATMAALLLVTAAAAWVPATRASRVDPLLAIRTE